ncbi:uridine kinase [Spongisporangium articulatum]|uniref:Uridine kinase n=1 Tax=Spongisporangium articulatum TaxID=3362603 RepID=A0ABW8APL7_9ACTN
MDGPVEADTRALADDVAGLLEARAVPVARVSAGDFLRGRSVRLEYGRDDPEAMYRLWYDTDALRREVLDPFEPGGRGTWLPRLRDPETDRAYRENLRDVVPGAVVVLDGRFLLRDDVRWSLDLTVHLDVSAAARARRVPAEEAARLLPAWERYLDDVEPAARADLTVRFDHPDRPALRER